MSTQPSLDGIKAFLTGREQSVKVAMVYMLTLKRMNEGVP